MNDWNRNMIHKGATLAINFGRSAAKGIIRAHHRRAAIRELRALDDRTLKDIGLHRSQIRSVVEEMLNATTPPDVPISTSSTIPANPMPMTSVVRRTGVVSRPKQTFGRYSGRRTICLAKPD